MNIKSRIEAFNRENQPFNIYDFEDGKYGLSLSIDFSNGPFKGYRQEAFNQYDSCQFKIYIKGRMKTSLSYLFLSLTSTSPTYFIICDMYSWSRKKSSKYFVTCTYRKVSGNKLRRIFFQNKLVFSSCFNLF